MPKQTIDTTPVRLTYSNHDTVVIRVLSGDPVLVSYTEAEATDADAEIELHAGDAYAWSPLDDDWIWVVSTGSTEVRHGRG